MLEKRFSFWDRKFEFQFLCGGFSKIFRFFEVSDDEAEGKS